MHFHSVPFALQLVSEDGSIKYTRFTEDITQANHKKYGSKENEEEKVSDSAAINAGCSINWTVDNLYEFYMHPTV